MSGHDPDMEMICEFCKKLFPQKILLRHIAKKKDCKAYYGQRFTDMKKQNATQRKSKYRKKKFIEMVNQEKALREQKLEKFNKKAMLKETKKDSDKSILYKSTETENFGREQEY